MMHLDTLAGFDELKICRAYKLDGKEINFFPSNAGKLERVECLYETVQGWPEDISNTKDFNDLPANAQNYVSRIEHLTGIPVTIIGVGPERKQSRFHSPCKKEIR